MDGTDGMAVDRMPAPPVPPEECAVIAASLDEGCQPTTAWLVPQLPRLGMATGVQEMGASQL